MEFILKDTSAIYSVFFIAILLYIPLLILLIVKEIKKTNAKFQSFLWIFSSFIIPVIPWVYVILLLIKKTKNKRQ